jgi:hypothetical protein
MAQPVHCQFAWQLLQTQQGTVGRRGSGSVHERLGPRLRAKPYNTARSCWLCIELE